MSEFLTAAAANIGAPEDLVQRSAEARSETSGQSVEAILSAWAGGASVEAAAPALQAEEQESAPAVASEPGAETTAETTAVTNAAETQAPAADDVPETQAAASAVGYLPTPDTVTRSESLDYNQVTTVATTGLQERTSPRFPGWLLAVFALLPVLAVGYLIVNSGGVHCGEAGQMEVDFAGNLQTCDQRAFVFTPGVSASGGIDLAVEFAAGAEAYASECAACHNADGSGGVGPALTGGAVLETWPACDGHIDWVAVGGSAWGEATYGAQSKPVNGGSMPGFAEKLDKEALIQVVLYERVAFGGQDIDEAGADCGYETSDSSEGAPVEPEIDALAMFAAGQELYTAKCQACHNADGSQGAGPAMAGGAVIETFPTCDAQIEWVALGSSGWSEATYGAQEKPVNGGMPGFDSQNTLEEIKQIVLYERVAFGNENIDEAAASCFG